MRIDFRPRPMTRIYLMGRPFTALLDSGSARSFVNITVGQHCHRHRYRPHEILTPVRLADGGEVTVTEWYNVPTTIGRQMRVQTFGVMTDLSPDIILGVDALAAFRIGIPPPPVELAAATVASTGSNNETHQCSASLEAFLASELPKFESIRGPTDVATHRIHLKDARPIKQRYRPRNPAMQEIIDQEVQKMEQAGVIEPSSSPWSSPVVIARKKDGRPRFCIDFRKVNEVSEKDAYPLPQVNATLDKLRGARYLSTIDLKDGYWQIPLAPESRPITAFTVPGRGLMQFRVMPFGLHSAPATFQRLLDTILGPALEPHVFVYLDDIIVVSPTLKSHLQHLGEVFRRLRESKLRINPDKCRFGVNELKYLGHVVTREGVHTDPAKIEAVARIPAPRNIREIRQFVGMLSWYRRFIPRFSERARPLTCLTGKRAKWKWAQEEEDAFLDLKKALTTTPVLACPDFAEIFTLQTDASSTGLGAVLTQTLDGHERVIAYASRTLNKAEQNYSVTEKECLAVVWGIRKLRAYLEGYRFIVLTDHQSLKWLMKMEDPTGRLARWALELQQYDFEICYRRGALNNVADALSRSPLPTATCAADIAAVCPWYQPLYRAVRNRPDENPDYCIRDGRLYRHILHSLNKDDTGDEWKMCVPTSERPAILHRNHDAPTAGHLGIAKTISRLARTYYWPGMFRDAAKHVKTCESCRVYKPAQQGTAGRMLPFPAERPWQIVAVDLVGPLPRSKKGHAWLLAAQDKYTKYSEILPLRRATAVAVTEGIYRNVILRHGAPEIIISDNGKQFISREFQGMLRDAGITPRLTPPYTPQCNPEERLNRVIKTMIGQYAGRQQKTWDALLPEIQFALNTAVHDSTGYTPAFLDRGRELRPPGGPATGRISAPPDISQRVKQLTEAQEVARINMARAFQRQAHHYNLRRRDWRPRLGDTVYTRSHELSRKTDDKAAKLLPRFRGPYTITKVVSPNIYNLRDRNGRCLKTVHISQLKPSG